MKVNETIQMMESEGAKTLLAKLYGEDAVAGNVARYQELLKGYEKAFGDSGDVLLFSSPGRTEISGNAHAITARCWREALTWIAWALPQRTAPAMYIL